MAHVATHNAFCFTLFTLVGLAFGLVFTSSLASSADHRLAPSATLLAPSSMNQPCPAGSAPVQAAL